MKESSRDDTLPHQIKTIYRYNFSDEIILLLTHFSRLHMYTDRKTYKEKWKEWTKENESKLTIESKRLKDLGYNGDIDDKMIKATRYYFKKKILLPQKENDSQYKSKRNYIILDSEIISSMDNHIISNYDINFKPSIGFENFNNEYKDILNKEIIRLQNLNSQELNTRERCLYKLKKTYKNRYFIYTKKLYTEKLYTEKLYTEKQ